MPHEESSLALSGASPPWDRPSIWMGFLVILTLFVVYRRLRSQFGAQALRPVRLGIRIAVLLAIGLAVGAVAAHSSTSCGVGVLGLAAGIGLGAIASSRTRFTMRTDVLHYIPHTATGVFVSTLLLVRLGVRLAHVYSGVPSGGEWPGAAGPDSSGAGVAAGLKDLGPLTTGLLFLLIGYYVFYYSQLLWKSKHLKPSDLDEFKPSP